MLTMSAPASDEVTKSITITEESGGRRSSNDDPVSIAAEHNVLSVVIQTDVSPKPQPPPPPPPHPCHQWLMSIMKEGAESPSNTPKLPRQKIDAVPQMLRQMKANLEHYVPKVVSIGPNYNKATKPKKFKIQFTREYVKSCGHSIEVLYKEVEKVADAARKCYVEGTTDDFNDIAFTKMMFLDGCFILQYIHYMGTGKKEEQAKMKMKSNEVAFVRRDLFLLENQLPFIVLQALMSKNSNFVGRKGLKLINNFIRDTMHFKKQKAGLAESHSQDQPVHLLELMWRQLIDPNASRYENQEGSTRGLYLRRSATDHRIARIQFRPNKTDRLTDIKFIPEGWIDRAVLTLPPIKIDETTMPMVLNLVAFETCPDSSGGCLGVTNYICFLASMITSANDVKELKYAGIMANSLRNDEEAVKVIHGIAAGLVPEDTSYFQTKSRIEEHYRKITTIWIRIWTDILMREKTWTLVALYGFLFTIIQTIFTIVPFPNQCQESICQYLKNNTLNKNGG